MAKRRLLEHIVCPHCWARFKPEEVLWIAQSPNLKGDRVLSENDAARFLPTEFNADGFAIDLDGYPCSEHACPRCHLRLPQGALEAPTLFMSIVGAPATGKSYYLASSTFRLRSVLPRDFMINFTDADAEMNQRVREIEDLQFFSGDKFVKLEKTEANSGDMYDMVSLNGQSTIFPRPFVFSARPANDHPNLDKTDRLARTICLYDNAGESYLASRDADAADAPVTRHLAQSACIFFLFDPTQDARFRNRCKEFSDDPQLLDADDLGKTDVRRSTQRQEAVLSEMIKRVRTYLKMKNADRYKKPFIVIVPKLDVWKPLVSVDNLELIAKVAYKGVDYNALNMKRLKRLSDQVRGMLMDYAPEFVGAVDSFASDVAYLPVSATGISPTVSKETGTTGFRSNDLKPIWPEIPMLYAISRTAPGLIPVDSKDASGGSKLVLNKD